MQKYIEGLIRQVASSPVEQQAAPGGFEADWTGFVAGGLDDLAPLPPEAFSREAIYGEDD